MKPLKVIPENYVAYVCVYVCIYVCMRVCVCVCALFKKTSVFTVHSGQCNFQPRFSACFLKPTTTIYGLYDYDQHLQWPKFQYIPKHWSYLDVLQTHWMPHAQNNWNYRHVQNRTIQDHPKYSRLEVSGSVKICLSFLPANPVANLAEKHVGRLGNNSLDSLQGSPGQMWASCGKHMGV